MSGDSKFSRLCRLVDQTSVQCKEMELASLTREQENDLLVALSQVLRKIQLWTRELDGESDSDSSLEPLSDKNLCGGSELRDEKHNCLTKVLGEMMLLMSVESRYVQHLAGNILEAVSEFIAVSGNGWNSFVCSLCNCLPLAITNVLSFTPASSENKVQDSTGDSSSFVVLGLALKNGNWYTVAGIIRVLRYTLKYLAQECADELLEVYLDSVSALLSNLPWDFMDEIFLGHSNTWDCNSPNGHTHDALFRGHAGEKEPRILFLGNFIQFLCSLVECSGTLEAKVGSQHRHEILYTIINIVPKISRWCIGEPGNCAKMPFTQYFRHKLLMLMLRISYQTHLCWPTLVSWLQLLHNYFEEFLQKSITGVESGQYECLEGSPFSLSHSGGGMNDVHSLHLQRQAVFLFLRCCFSLISLKGENSKQCTCANFVSCSTFDSVSDLECCKRKGYSELYKWLQGHLPIYVLMHYENYSEKYTGFASSFLKLYMHEDDVLFKVLLQLLSIPSYPEKKFNAEKCSVEEVEENILFHVSNLFHPVYLLHLFLAELHYDHQVLLDYLISKDTGISCAEYLLRSLRTICNSWNLFKKFSMNGNVASDSSCKKRKFLLDGSNFRSKPSSVSGKGSPSSFQEEHERDYEHGRNIYKTKRKPFIEAKSCLLSLKDSLDNLHQKNLFPYNPKVLLKRLTTFHDLCSSQVD